MNARSPKANLKVSSAPFQTDAPHEVAVKARFPSSEPIPTARNGLFCQRNPIPENPVKSRFFSPEPPKAPRNGLSRQRNLTCAFPVKSRVFQTETAVGGRKWFLLSNRCGGLRYSNIQNFYRPPKTAYNIDHENKILHSDSTSSSFAGSVVLFGQRQRIWRINIRT